MQPRSCGAEGRQARCCSTSYGRARPPPRSSARAAAAAALAPAAAPSSAAPACATWRGQRRVESISRGRAVTAIACARAGPTGGPAEDSKSASGAFSNQGFGMEGLHGRAARADPHAAAAAAAAAPGVSAPPVTLRAAAAVSAAASLGGGGGGGGILGSGMGGNGMAPPTAEEAPAVSADMASEIAELRDQLQLLTSLVTQQQVVLEQGQQELQSLRRENADARAGEAQTQMPSIQHSNVPLPTWAMSERQTNSLTDVQRSSDAEDLEWMAANDRRVLGLYDSRYHSTSSRATPRDLRVLPDRIILLRHAESEGNIDNEAYTFIPDSQIPLTDRGKQQACDAGQKIRQYIEARSGNDYRLFCYLSPYKRSLQTFEGVACAFPAANILGVQEEVQLREQDFGNFQNLAGKQHEKAERLRFGRFFYRFPNGESGADVYDRITIFEDHVIRDINAGRFAHKTNLVLVTHGLALRVFLMRWFHWTLAQYLMVHNPPNAVPLVLERVTNNEASRGDGDAAWMHTKALYQLSPESLTALKGCTADMCTTGIMPRTSALHAQAPR